ncbi:MAG: hypothetical protein HN348_05005 [Proteobacteria bacterium]|nr:hypothetical protein [Pseudomonadota bacterium]
MLIEVADEAALRPGREVAVYLWDQRQHPVSGQLFSGMRYGGDGRIVWQGESHVEIQLFDQFQQVHNHHGVILGEPQGQAPTPAWRPPIPVDVAPVDEAPAPQETGVDTHVAVVEPEATIAVKKERPRPFERIKNTYLERYDGRRQSLVISGGWAGDGHNSGAGLGSVGWRYHPRKGLGLVELGLEGLRSNRWVTSDVDELGDDEYTSREPALAYWLWTRLDSPGTIAVFGGLGAGVDISGLSVGGMVGLRLGPLEASRAELFFTQYGKLGGRLTLDGRVTLTEALRLGVRTRLGNLPKHNGWDIRQARADGALLVSFDPARWLTISAAGGLAGYDLTFKDSGPVIDAQVEVRW